MFTFLYFPLAFIINFFLIVVTLIANFFLLNLQSGLSKSVLAQNTPQSGAGASASTSHEDVSSTSTSSAAKSSHIPILTTRRYSRINNTETDKITHTEKRGSKQKPSTSEIEATTSQESLASTSSSTRNSYRSKLRNSETKKEVEERRSRSRTDSNRNQPEGARKKSNEKYRKKNNISLNIPLKCIDYTLPANQPVQHNYSLRNRLSSGSGNSTITSNNRVSTQDHNKKESVALGASTSHQATREEQEPSRLTRSGAVLRRSTRNSKGTCFFFF